MPVITFNAPDIQDAIVIAVCGPLRSGKHLIMAKIAQWIQRDYGVNVTAESVATLADVDEDSLQRTLRNHAIVMVEHDIRIVNAPSGRPAYLTGRIDSVEHLRKMGGYGKVVG